MSIYCKIFIEMIIYYYMQLERRDIMKIKNETIIINNEKRIEIDELIIPTKGIIGMKGKSGSGKSTLLNHINHGQLSHYFLNHISYMKQKNLFFSFMNMKQNILFQMTLIKKDFNQDLFNQLINDFQLNHLIKKKPKALSTGEMQRFGFILQVLKQSPIILLDEPTASVNHEYIHLMKKYILQLSQSCLIILTSHNPEMFEICDSLYEIQDNHLVCLKYMEDDHQDYQKNKLSFPFYQFTSLKFINHFKKNLIFYIAIALICSIIGLMHSFKDVLLEEQLLHLDNFIQNEMYIVKTEQPYEVRYTDADLPVTNGEYQQLLNISAIKCYPMYTINNIEPYYEEKTPVTVSENQKTVEVLDNIKVQITPYFSEEIIKNNLIEGQNNVNGIYISENFQMLLENQDLMSLTLEFDAHIPSHYITNGNTKQFINEQYTFSSSSFIGESEHLIFSQFDGIINADYYGYANNQFNIFVPYSYIETLVSRHQSHENIYNETDKRTYMPFSFGAVYIEVNDITKMKEIKNQIQSISDDFHIFYSYQSIEEAVQVFEEFKHTIEIFEYTGIVVTMILAIGFWYLRKDNDLQLKNQLYELRLSKLDFIKYLLCDILLETVLVVLMTVIITNLIVLYVQKIGYFYYIYDMNVLFMNIISAIILTSVMRIIVEGRMLYD